jgi:hypothetical protein
LKNYQERIMVSRLVRNRLFGFSLLLVLIGLAFTACDNINSLFPETYQEVEFEMSDTDYRACELLTIADEDTLGNPLTVTIKSVYDTTAAAYDTLTADTSDASIGEINAAHDALLIACALAILPPDTTIDIDYPNPAEEEDNRSFAIYTPQTTGANDITAIFFLNDNVNLEVMDRNGVALDRSSESITYEAFGGCTEVIELGPESYDYDPKLKLRYAYNLTPGTTYLIRLTYMDTFTQSEDTTPPWQPFRVVILEETP